MEYSMYTPEGNAEVDKMVSVINHSPMPIDQRWPVAYAGLKELAKDPRFAEATDTAVRESVYHAVGNVGNFYI
jgi:hypothetical protein